MVCKFLRVADLDLFKYAIHISLTKGHSTVCGFRGCGSGLSVFHEETAHDGWQQVSHGKHFLLFVDSSFKLKTCGLATNASNWPLSSSVTFVYLCKALSVFRRFCTMFKLTSTEVLVNNEMTWEIKIYEFFVWDCFWGYGKIQFKKVHCIPFQLAHVEIGYIPIFPCCSVVCFSVLGWK